MLHAPAKKQDAFQLAVGHVLFDDETDGKGDQSEQDQRTERSKEKRQKQA